MDPVRDRQRAAHPHAAGRAPQAPLSLSIVIPAHNEAETIEEVVRTFTLACRTVPWIEAFEIIVVDDASTDGTGDIARQAGATVITRGPLRSLGYGYSITFGVHQAKHPWICIVDGDATYPPFDLIRLLTHAGNSNMVVAHRYGWLAGNGTLHLLGRWALNRVARCVTHADIRDLNSGYRVFPKAFFQAVAGELPDGFSLSSTLTLLAHQRGHPVKYVPILYHKRGGRSKVSRVRGWFGILGLIWKHGRYHRP